jgi:hypothetical protein
MYNKIDSVKDYSFYCFTFRCYSSVGRKTGGQILNLGPGCFTEQIILHELLHALGFWHEHSRTDRDNYVDIKYNNIIDGTYCFHFIYGPLIYDKNKSIPIKVLEAISDKKNVR